MFLHIPSVHFLCRLQEKLITVNQQTILMDEKDWTTFQRLEKCSQALSQALGSAAKQPNGSEWEEGMRDWSLSHPVFHGHAIDLTLFLHETSSRMYVEMQW